MANDILYMFYHKKKKCFLKKAFNKEKRQCVTSGLITKKAAASTLLSILDHSPWGKLLPCHKDTYAARK